MLHSRLEAFRAAFKALPGLRDGEDGTKRGEKSLNSTQLLGSRPFQDRRQTANLMQMSHSHSSHAEGNLADKKIHAGCRSN
jgi:hypothetical protein